MFYRVDYLLALLAAGAAVAAVLSGRAARIAPQRLASGYLIAIAVIVGLRAALFVAVFAAQVPLPAPAFLAVGDVGVVLLGALYGIAAVHAVRGGFAAVLGAPELRVALCLPVGVGFALVTVGKTLSLDFMLDFFAQSHYPRSFLFVTMGLEVLGGAVILLPWRGTRIAAAGVLAVMMFGAIYTHWHNGEPFDYSRDAVAVLLWLAPIAVLDVGWRRAALAAAVCGAAAIAGGTRVRIPPDTGEFAFFLGSWQCSGDPGATAAAPVAAPVAADLHIDQQAGSPWLLLRLDDHPPAHQHTLTEWRREPTGWIASVQDEHGGLATYRSPGWQGATLTWDGHDLDGGGDQRWVYQRLDDVRFTVRHDVRDGTSWRSVTALTCTH